MSSSKCHHLKTLILSHQFTLISAEKNQNAETENIQMQRGGVCMGLHTRLARSNHWQVQPQAPLLLSLHPAKPCWKTVLTSKRITPFPSNSFKSTHTNNSTKGPLKVQTRSSDKRDFTTCTAVVIFSGSYLTLTSEISTQTYSMSPLSYTHSLQSFSLHYSLSAPPSPPLLHEPMCLYIVAQGFLYAQTCYCFSKWFFRNSFTISQLLNTQ